MARLGLLTIIAVASLFTTAHSAQLDVIDDSYINLNQANQNNGSSSVVSVRNFAGERQGLVRFDIAPLPPGATVAQATLRQWVVRVQNEGTVELHTILGAWDEGAVTASSAPAMDPSVLASIALTSADADGFVTVDITSVVQAWADGSIANNGIAFLPSSASNVRIDFASKEGSAGSPMEIDVTLEPSTGIPSGAIILWDQSGTCPDGFSRVTSYDDKFLVGASAPGISGGANSHLHGGGSLTAADHRHNLESWNGSFPPVDDNSGGTDFNARTDVASGGGVSGTTASADSRPAFRTILLCRKD